MRITHNTTRHVNDMARKVRARRNALLAACDWTQGRDISNPIQAVWASYRALLRNVPLQPGFPFNVNWPEQPN